jgi:hypothetical protein
MASREGTKQPSPAKALADSLYDDFEVILEEDLGLLPFSELTISGAALYEAAARAQEALKDLRSQYYRNVSTIKYIATVMFWIVKCKPINSILVDSGGSLIDAPEVNEHVALNWGLKKLLEYAQDGQLRELIPNTRAHNKGLRKIIYFYKYRDIYRNAESGEGVPNTTKYGETVYYFRCKKITAVYIYEILLHMIVSYRAIARV